MSLPASVGRIVGLVLCLVGAALSGTLWTAHASGPGGLWAAACGDPGSGCDQVLSSRWATIGGLPVAALGLFYFSILAVGIATLGIPSRRRRAVQAFCALGAAASAGFIVLMGTVVDAWCPLCLGVHACNVLLLGQVAFLTPRSGETPPSLRLALTAAVLAAAVVAAEAQAFKALRLESELARVSQELRTYSQDAHAVELKYMQTRPADLRIRDDDPMIPALPGTRNTVVVFSDIECPHCARFDRFLVGEVKPLYQGRLRIVFKHLPLEKLHPNAYRGATALEAARLQGRFWDMHDLLLRERERLRSVDYGELAREAGLDPDRLLRDMTSEPVRRRIEEDVRQAERLGLHAAPGVFLNSRPIDRSVRDLLGFWKLRAAAITPPAGAPSGR